MTCPHLQNGNCEISSKLAGVPVPIAPGVCEACTPFHPEFTNRVTASRASWQLRKDGVPTPPEIMAIAKQAPQLKQQILKRKVRPRKAPTPSSSLPLVGDTLHSILSSWGITMTSGCSCKQHRVTMNTWGPQKCLENIDTIVGWLRAEAKKRHLPFSKFLAKKLVKFAVARTENQIKSLT